MKKTNLPVIDITKGDWVSQISNIAYPRDLEECKIQALGHAAAIARKFLPVSTIDVIVKEEDICEGILPEEEEKSSEAAVRVGSIVVSNKYHPAIEEGSNWINTHQLELIEKLLSGGYEIEILDEFNNVIRKLKKNG